MGELEGQIQTQNDIDKIYDDFCTIVKNEMSSKLPKKEYVIRDGACNKRRRIRKPWWNEDLQCLWNEMCRAEKIWLRCKGRQKSNLKHLYVQKRKIFDQQVQRCKRDHWFQIQHDMVENAEKIQISSGKQLAELVSVTTEIKKYQWKLCMIMAM